MGKHHIQTKEIHAGSLQEIRCVECRWCCENEVYRIVEESLDVYVLKGCPLMYDEACQAWFVVYPQRCKYLTEFGCSIYDSPDKPKMCGDYMCPHPEVTMKVKHPELVKSTKEKIKQCLQ